MDESSGKPKPTVHIVVTCANRKKHPVSVKLSLRSLSERSPGPRVAAWTKRLMSAETPTVPAADLYAGEHWQVARELPAASPYPARLWVCSAGYGLIPATAPIQPYGATFSAGVPDSVGDSMRQVRDWWNRLSQWAGPVTDQPRSFGDLARRDPDTTIVAVLSDAYLRACADDLRDAATHLGDEEQLAVIGPAGRCADVEDLLVPVTARLRPLVGGSLQALNVRASAHLLIMAAGSGSPLRRTHLRQLSAQATSQAPADPGRRPAGIRLTDDEVRGYIRSRLSEGPAPATRLLRALRDTGQSCEQGRFRQLVAEVTGVPR